jgi:hypothetical protein
MNKLEGGDCGCSGKMTGGNGTLPALNLYNEDPQRMQESVRMNPNMAGGRKSKRRRMSRKMRKSKKGSRRCTPRRKRTRRMRGGNTPSYLDGIAFSTGTLSGSTIGANISTGMNNHNMNPSTLSNFHVKPFV